MTENDTEVAPTCYRHPGRETYVRCTRCDRPICPDCMTPAAVGFQCPECVREGNKSVRQARTVFGGRVSTDGTVTRILIGLCVVAFIGQLANDRITFDYGMSPVDVAYGDWWRLLTSAFLHEPTFLLHIAFNMYALFAFGGQVERLVGRSRFLVLYLVAALGGSVATYWLGNPGQLSIGASGAVFGLFGAYFVMARKLRADTSQIMTLIGINLVIGIVGHNYINNWAHLGGLATGALVAWIYTQVPRGQQQSLLQYTGAAAVVLALLAGVLVRTPELKRQCVDLPPVVQDQRIQRCGDLFDGGAQSVGRHQ